MNALTAERNLAIMDQYYVVLAEALRERLAAIADHQLRDQNPNAHLSRLKQASDQIDRHREKLPTDADPMLAHYLSRMSLSKAQEFVQHRYLR